MSGLKPPPSASDLANRLRNNQDWTTAAPAQPYKGALPWAGANPRIKVGYTLRLDEPLHLKLKFLAERSPHSMHQIALEAIEAHVEKLLAEFVGEENARK
ncbi:hypothetical protein [Achromobacter animicus]|uniref:hypothetical protein n=1 Tax=Achromobacter animicus TaxID=1389935 RepID=UPI0028A9AE2A|nr:hypothetical protein [Achromobacter animicus]